MQSERRKHTRVDFEGTVPVVCADGQTRSAEVTDISMTGIRLRLDPPLAVQRRCRITIPHEPAFSFLGEVVHSSPQTGSMGVRVKGIRVAALGRLFHLVTARHSDPKQIQEELLADDDFLGDQEPDGSYKLLRNDELT